MTGPSRWRWLEEAVQDVRYGARTLVKHPGFSITAIATLALATGATTAIFSVVNGVVLRPLPFAEPDRLVQVFGRAWRTDRGAPDPVDGPVGSLELEAFANHSTLFEGFTGYGLTTRHLDGPAGPERLTAVISDRGFFDLLGVRTVAGRTFRADDPMEVAVISARLWRSRFNADPAIAGRSVTLDGRAFTVIGVVPDAFQFPYGAAASLPGALPETRTDIWIPIEAVRTASGALRRGRVNVTGRLKPGATIERAAAELDVVAARIEQEQRGAIDGLRIQARVVPLADDIIGPVRRSLWMLFAAVGLVLAAACANVANLLLSRMAVRAREVVTRAALGAGRLRLVRQFLVESLVLSLAGGLIGAAIARWGSQLLVALGSARIPRAHEVALDWTAFAFLLAACVAIAVLFGLAPAITAARVEMRTGFGESSRATMGRGYGRLRDALVVTEIALAFVLASGATLLMREIVRLHNVDTGMRTDNVLTLHLTPRTDASDYYAIEERVAAIPGVEAAGFTQLVPLQNWGWTADFSIRGRAADGRPTTGLRYVTPGYFHTLGIPIVRGRGFDRNDHADAPRVILINEALARRYFAAEDPVGIELDRGTIVGVVGDVRQVGLDKPAEPEIYYPAAQNVAMTSDIGMSLMVRTSGRPESVVEPVRAAVREINPKLAIFNVKTMERVRADAIWELNLYRWLIGVFAALALVLAAIGLYGVISYNATSRTREFAVRLALGSDPASLAGLVLVRASRLASAGIVLGIAAVFALAPLLRTLPVGSAIGRGTYAATSLVIAVIAFAACLAPALRVARVNPAAALRHE